MIGTIIIGLILGFLVLEYCSRKFNWNAKVDIWIKRREARMRENFKSPTLKKKDAGFGLMRQNGRQVQISKKRNKRSFR